MWFQLFSQAKIQSCTKVRVSYAAKLSGLFPALCLHGPPPSPDLIRVPVPCIGSMKKRMMLIANLLFGTKDICNCSLYLAFWDIISKHRAEGTEVRFSRRGQGFDPPTGSAVCCSMCPPVSQDIGGEHFLDP